MKLREAVIRAFRTAAQTAAASIAVIPILNAVTEAAITGLGESLAVIGINSGLAGLVAFLQNIAEDNTGLPPLGYK